MDFRYGEPFSYFWDIAQLLDMLSASGVDVCDGSSIVTSGLYYLREFRTFLERYGLILQISLDGAFRHNRMRTPTRAMYDTVIRNIKQFRQSLDSHSIMSLMLIHRLNVDDLPAAFDYVHRRIGIERIIASPIDNGIPFVLSGNFDRYVLNHLKAFLYAYDQWASGVEIYTKMPRVVEYFINFDGPIGTNGVDISPCGAVKGRSIYIHYDGSIYPCAMAMLLHRWDPQRYSYLRLGSVSEPPEAIFSRYQEVSKKILSQRLTELKFIREFGFVLGCDISMQYFALLNGVQDMDKFMGEAYHQLERVRNTIQDILSKYDVKKLRKYSDHVIF